MLEPARTNSASSILAIASGSTYYAGGPWCAVGAGVYGTAGGVWGNSYSCYSGWADYAARKGIVCTPGTVIKGGDGILYLCQ